MAVVYIKLDVWDHSKAKWHIQRYVGKKNDIGEIEAIIGQGEPTICGIHHTGAVRDTDRKPLDHLICKRCLKATATLKAKLKAKGEIG